MMADQSPVHAQVKVRDHGPGLLRPRLNAEPVCDDSTTEGKYVNVTLYKWTYLYL